MLDKIVEYSNYKFMISAIFQGEDYIIENSKKSEIFKNRFYNYNNLIYLSEVLRECLKVEVFDSTKINAIRKVIRYYINEFHSKNQKEVEICKIILLQTYKPFRKSTNDFYMEQYQKRYRKPCEKLSEEIKTQIDKEVIEDSVFLDNLIFHYNEEPDNSVGNIQFLRSINIFINECPEILYEDRIYNNIYEIIEKNKNYVKDTELQGMNNTLMKLFLKNRLDDVKLSHQLILQAYFSNIFSQDINSLINELRKAPNKKTYFDEDGLEILRNLIIENQSKNMFDETRLNNLRELLIAFNKEGVLSLDELNELKRNLNFNIDSDYERKNKEFYFNILNIYSDRLESIDYKKTKNLVNILIQNTGDVMLQLLSLSQDSIEKLAKDDCIVYYLNYLMNNYPLIRENAIYMDKISDILYYNGYYLEEKEDKDFITIAINKELQKKINKLRK